MNRFAIIPYDLYDDLANGEITLSMFQAMILLHKWADWQTGVVRKVRASRMEQASGEHGPAARTFQRALKSLHDSGRITSYHVAGSRSWYKIDINNFTALSGALKDTLLRPTEIKDWRVLDRDGGAEQGGEEGCEDACEEGGEEATVLKSSQKSLQQSEQKSESALSLSNSLSSREKSAQRETGDDKEWFHELQAGSTLPVAAARAAAATILEELIGQPYTRQHDKTVLPEMIKLFSNGTPPQDLFNRISIFMEWVTAKGLASRFTSMKDFFFHWNNESGRENGFRAQFEAECRAASNDVTMKEVRKNLRRYVSPEI